jgi:hypothetical protein
MPRVLVIGEAQRRAINEIIQVAAQHRFDPDSMRAAVDEHGIDGFRDMMKLHSINLPVGFHVTYTREYQKKAPPPGICHHISVSVSGGKPGALPSPPHVQTILKEFGMQPIEASDAVWVEEIDGVPTAVNIVQLMPTLQ